MRVLIIPEDFRKDQHILKPLFERLFRSLAGETLASGFAKTRCSVASGKRSGPNACRAS